MHLKSLTLKGFKSFASATTLRLEPGITCVVGPNGSGKSNVVDAISWVLGEQGAKALRGGKMEDVIFAGTSGRAPLGRAEVTLTIDNADGALPIDYAEVSITRRMFRDGAGEYEINGSHVPPARHPGAAQPTPGSAARCTSSSGRASSTRCCSRSPEDRRAYIEEAAGVLKHRKRKEKALRKLDAMQANLTRLDRPHRASCAASSSRWGGRPRSPGGPRPCSPSCATRGCGWPPTTSSRCATSWPGRRRTRRAPGPAALEVEEQLAVARAEQERLEDALAQDAPRLAAAQDTWYRLSALAERLRGTVGLAQERARHLADAGDARTPGRDPDELEAEADVDRRAGGGAGRGRRGGPAAARGDHWRRGPSTSARSPRPNARTWPPSGRSPTAAPGSRRSPAGPRRCAAAPRPPRRRSSGCPTRSPRRRSAPAGAERARRAPARRPGSTPRPTTALEERVAEAAQAHEAARARVRRAGGARAGGRAAAGALAGAGGGAVGRAGPPRRLGRAARRRRSGRGAGHACRRWSRSSRTPAPRSPRRSASWPTASPSADSTPPSPPCASCAPPMPAGPRCSSGRPTAERAGTGGPRRTRTSTSRRAAPRRRRRPGGGPRGWSGRPVAGRRRCAGRCTASWSWTTWTPRAPVAAAGLHRRHRRRRRARGRTGRPAAPGPGRARSTCRPRSTRPRPRPATVSRRSWPGCARRWRAPGPRRPRAWPT